MLYCPFNLYNIKKPTLIHLHDVLLASLLKLHLSIFTFLGSIDYEKILYTLQIDLAFFKALGKKRRLLIQMPNAGSARTATKL
jgi:hypothetical protein